MKHACVVAASLAACLFCSIASAAPSEGELLFREGRTAMTEKNFDVACTKFAESQKKEPAPGTALNLGECEEQRGHLVAAAEAFSLAASSFLSADKQKYASSRAEAADRRIPRLIVRAPNAPPGLVVRVGDEVVTLGAEVKVDPGDIVVRAEAPGRKPSTQEASLREGKNLEIEIGALEPLESSGGEGESGASAATPADEGDAPDLRLYGLVAGGVGAAALAVGGVTGLLALDKASTVESRCGKALLCDAEGLDAAQSGSTLSTVSTVSFIAGGTLVVGGALLYFLSPRAAKTTGAVQVVPTASRSAGGVVVFGAF